MFSFKCINLEHRLSPVSEDNILYRLIWSQIILNIHITYMQTPKVLYVIDFCIRLTELKTT